jgi:predicted DCC family thiol-disulfide oxidoreductase YuxK
MDNLVYFDGICGLCNKFVDFLLRKDKKHQLRFTPLQGHTASQRIPTYTSAPPDSVIFETKGKIYFQSGAAIRILYTLGGFWKLSIVFLIIPAFLRNAVYKFIAQNRYKWFGKKESCRIPSPEERKYFLP